MKIGIDCRLWSESGVGRYIRNLVKNLQAIDKKNDYVLFVGSKDYENIKYQSFDKLRTKIKNNWKLRLADARWHTVEEQLKFPQIINKVNLDLMHFPYISVPIFYNKPFIVTIHDLILYHFPTGEASTLPLPLYRLKLLGYKFIIKRAAQNAAQIITVSNATKIEVIEHLGINENKIIVTYEGIDEKILNSKLQIPNKFKIQNSKFKELNKYFLYVSNAYPHKNLDRLIDAFSTLNSQSFDFAQDRLSTLNLILVGREDYFYKRLKEKVKNMGLEKSVMFYGEATDEELQGLYRNALALIMPSLMEGFGLPVLEAMANKCLVLASDIPSLKEVCGDSAIYFDPYNTNDMYQIMKEIHFNDINPPVGEAGHYSDNILKGYERAKMFSWEKMAKETLKIYESCSSASSE